MRVCKAGFCNACDCMEEWPCNDAEGGLMVAVDGLIPLMTVPEEEPGKAATVVVATEEDVGLDDDSVELGGGLDNVGFVRDG